MKKISILIPVLLLAAFFSLRGFIFPQSYYFSIPIQFVRHSQIPRTLIEIEGKLYQVEIDLGTKMALSLNKDVLDKIKKDPNGISRRLDFRGNKYETPLYLIRNVKIGDLTRKKIKAREESHAFVNQGSVIYDYDAKTEQEIRVQDSGRIGRDLLENRNVFMDFHHSVFIVCKEINDLRKERYKIENLAPTPFQITSDGILLKIETDRGIQKFVLDTGTTLTVIRSFSEQENTIEQKEHGMPIFHSSKFIINGKDFGGRDLYLLEISSLFDEIDGLLGMDFLNEHAIYLDFAKNIAYIGKSADAR